MAKLGTRRAGAKELVFPNSRGGVEGHFLRKLKTVATRAKIETSVELHKFRRTFACWHSDANVPLRSLQGWLGHSSLEVTQSYLKGTDARSGFAQAVANNTFPAFD